jgi:hypothetical protein
MMTPVESFVIGAVLSRGAARLTVPIRKRRTLLGDAVDVRRRMAEGSASSGIGTKVIPPGVVGHEHDDVGSLLKLRGTPRADSAVSDTLAARAAIARVRLDLFLAGGDPSEKIELIGMGVSPNRCEGPSFRPCAATIKGMSALGT